MAVACHFRLSVRGSGQTTGVIEPVFDTLVRGFSASRRVVVTRRERHSNLPGCNSASVQQTEP